MPISRRNAPKTKKLLKLLTLLLIVFIFFSVTISKQSKKKLTKSIDNKVNYLQTVSENSALCKAVSDNSKILIDKYCLENKGKKNCKITNISNKDLFDMQKDLENLIKLCTSTIRKS